MNNPAANPYVSKSSGSSSGFGGSPDSIRAASRTGVIITFALIQGLVVVGCIMGWMGLSELEEGEALFRFDGDSLLFVAIGFVAFFGGAIMTVAARTFLHQQAVARFQAAGEEIPTPIADDTQLPPSAGQLIGSISAYTIIGQALLEGPAMINAIFMFLDSNLIFVIPLVLGSIGIGLQVPYPGRFRSAIENASM